MLVLLVTTMRTTFGATIGTTFDGLGSLLGKRFDQTVVRVALPTVFSTHLEVGMHLKGALVETRFASEFTVGFGSGSGVERLVDRFGHGAFKKSAKKNYF